jgi:hypothetical protein
VRSRDLVLVGVLILVGGVAVVDAFRDDDGRGVATPEPIPPPAPAPGRQPQPQREAPDDYPRGVLSGSLVLADERDCQFRIFGLAGGRERPVPPTVPLAEPCTFWTAARGGLIAYPTEELGGSELNIPFLAVGQPVGPAVVSPDGEHAAWCRSAEAGVEFDVNANGTREIGACPDAYAPRGDLAFVFGNRLLTEHRTVLRASGPISYVSWGSEGSIAVVEGPHERLERWQGNRLLDAVDIPDRLGGGTPVLSPDNCAALFQDVDQIWFEVIALDCFETERPDLLIFGDSTSVAWSPDGRWIAVAYSDRIGFHRVSDGEEIASWPARAAALAWTAD